MSLLEIKNLHVSVEGKKILRGIDLTVKAGEVHSIMGPNGSGKSTLAQVLAGHENFEVTEGTVLLDGKDLLEMDPDERAREGLFRDHRQPRGLPPPARLSPATAISTAMRPSTRSRTPPCPGMRLPASFT